MSKPLFKVGDKVQINRKAARWIIRAGVSLYIARRVKQVWYFKKGGYNLYFLGFNQRGTDISNYGFRAYMLDHYIPLPDRTSYNRARRAKIKIQAAKRANP